MATIDDLGVRRARLELQASLALLTGALVMATICAGIIASGWFAGAMDDPAERVFWAGSALAGIMVAVLAVAAWPGGDDDARAARRIRILLRVGLVLFVLAPTLCIAALIGDFYG
jgi:hypothetical protein